MTVYFEGAFNNFKIEKRGIFHCLDEGPYMTSLELLVDHYSNFADGLPVRLTKVRFFIFDDICIAAWGFSEIFG